MKIKFNSKNCIGCLLCVLSCHWQKKKTQGLGEADLKVFRSGEGWSFEVDAGACSSCGKCFEACPRSCLEFEDEP